MGWVGGIAEWVEGQDAYLSVPFTWNIQDAYSRACWLKQQGYYVHAGGPAVKLMPNVLETVAYVGPLVVDALSRHNPDATVTSRGCIRSCPFCAVPKTEGALVELPTWRVAPIVCDNNLLACSKTHFDKVIDSLKGIKGVDFNQGLDARLLSKYHADRLCELDCLCRLAWDHTNSGNAVMTGYERLRKAGMPKSRIQVYVLIGFNDTPDDALFRLRTVWNMGIKPNPMRYNPLDSLERDSYVAPSWTERELTRFMRYWANLRYTGAIPFEEFEDWRSNEEANRQGEVSSLRRVIGLPGGLLQL